jgi:hypothetical protein
VFDVDCTLDAKWFQNWYENKLAPAIREKMWWCKEVCVQGDNAPGHAGQGTPEFCKKFEGSKATTSVKYVLQPPQSPDTNSLDLGIFNCLQAAKERLAPKSGVYDIEQLVKDVKLAFKKMPEQKLQNIFLLKSRILEEIIKDNGGNSCKIPHK